MHVPSRIVDHDVRLQNWDYLLRKNYHVILLGMISLSLCHFIIVEIQRYIAMIVDAGILMLMVNNLLIHYIIIIGIILTYCMEFRGDHFLKYSPKTHFRMVNNFQRRKSTYKWLHDEGWWWMMSIEFHIIDQNTPFCTNA